MENRRGDGRLGEQIKRTAKFLGMEQLKRKDQRPNQINGQVRKGTSQRSKVARQLKPIKKTSGKLPKGGGKKTDTGKEVSSLQATWSFLQKEKAKREVGEKWRGLKWRRV